MFANATESMGQLTAFTKAYFSDPLVTQLYCDGGKVKLTARRYTVV
jgi:hypothetical protein